MNGTPNLPSVTRDKHGHWVQYPGRIVYVHDDWRLVYHGTLDGRHEFFAEHVERTNLRAVSFEVAKAAMLDLMNADGEPAVPGATCDGCSSTGPRAWALLCDTCMARARGVAPVDERQEFETWAAHEERLNLTQAQGTDGSRCYSDKRTMAAWHAWQAARGVNAPDGGQKNG